MTGSEGKSRCQHINVREPMRYRITIERIEQGEAVQPNVNSQTVTEVYKQTFDELNVAEMITRLNHVPVKRPRKPKASK